MLMLTEHRGETQVSDRRDVDGSRTERPAAVLPTVSEVLALDAFAPGASVVVVGGAALEAPVRWVHVSDSADVARLLEGGELLLSTGSGWPDDPRRLAHFVAQLAEVGAAGIVLELGAHYRYVPAVLADAARSADIALIVLHREVKFVTITEAVHRRIIADQTAALEARDAVRTLFTGLALRGAPTEFIVEQVGLTLAAPVVLESVGHEVVVAHVGGAAETRTLRDWARRSRAAAAAPDREGRTIVPVEARGIRWGWLVALPGAAHLAGRDAVLEQAATALALGRLADPGGEEWSRLGRRRVVDALIDGRFTSLSAVAARLDAAGMPLVGTVAFAVVALVSSGRGGDAVTVAAAADIAAAAIGVRVVCGTSTTLDDGSALVRTPLILAVAGRATSAADNRADAFAVALEDALRAGRVAERPLTRVVAALRDDHRLVAHAERMLDLALADGRARGGDLSEALTALLAHPSNRTAAAEAAHLSRSVFYQRIALLEDLLGVDFDDGEQVAALHVAVLTHRLHAAG